MGYFFNEIYLLRLASEINLSTVYNFILLMFFLILSVLTD